MTQPLTFSDRLRSIVKPTTAQVLAFILLSLVLLLASQFAPFLARLGITSAALDVTKTQLDSRLQIVLQSPIAAQAALLAFWATVGLLAYLVCWGLYNLLIEARNEVTLTTAYTNRTDYSNAKHWRGPFETLALKASAAVGLAIMLWSLRFGISFWLALVAGVLSNTTFVSAIEAILAVVGLALQFYAVFVFVQLTFTPWYRVITFTDR
jgi:hypothetical protein